MIYVVAYEGRCGEQAPLCWGAAALREGEVTWNAVTRRHVYEDLDDLASRRLITLLKRPIEVAPEHRDRPLVVLSIPRNSPASDLARPDTGRPGHLVTFSSTATHHHYVFESAAGLHTHARHAINKIINFILDADESDAGSVPYSV